MPKKVKRGRRVAHLMAIFCRRKAEEKECEFALMSKDEFIYVVPRSKESKDDTTSGG